MPEFLARLRRAVTPVRQSPLTPSQARDELRSRRDRWEALPYPKAQHPPGSDEGEVAGVDLALLAGDVAAIFWEYFATGRNTEFEVMKGSSAEDLRRALPSWMDPPAPTLERPWPSSRQSSLGRRARTDRLRSLPYRNVMWQ